MSKIVGIAFWLSWIALSWVLFLGFIASTTSAWVLWGIFILMALLASATHEANVKKE